ncbi:MAG: phospho-sugar mutase [Acidobacteriota bacterium]|nr:phospho-sugar mutase [Acidobacteriota bacterium]
MRYADDARRWIDADPDPATREELAALIDAGDEDGLARRFSHPLVFGTAGLRGPLMAGPAGMNRLSVRRATQGVVAWLAELGLEPDRGVVVGRDARHGSEAFNDEAVAVLLGAGVTVYEMPRPLPTPYVPYALAQLGAAAGIMITASHNPPRDNGYKLYAADGAQIIPPSDERVEHFMARAGEARLGERSSPGHHLIDESLLARYREHVVGRFGVGASELAITYTPLHGVGGAPMAELFAAAGYSRVTLVESQFAPDPAFPTLAFPNPEEPGALDLATARADEAGSRIVIANDPDADRLGVAVRGSSGWRVLRGDEIGWLLGDMLLAEARPGDVVATSVVSSTMLARMAAAAGVACVTTLTGFKWISRAAGTGRLLFGYEEAIGFAVDPLVADKDGLSAALAICALATRLSREGATLLTRLDELEERFGVHSGGALSVRAEGEDGLAALAGALADLTRRPPSTLGAESVANVVDLATGWRGLVTEGVLFELANGRVIVRPSGTEAKLKVYVELVEDAGEDLAATRMRGAVAVATVLEDLEQRLRV